jgi:hypothetical protein
VLHPKDNILHITAMRISNSTTHFIHKQSKVPNENWENLKKIRLKKSNLFCYLISYTAMPHNKELHGSYRPTSFS